MPTLAVGMAPIITICTSFAIFPQSVWRNLAYPTTLWHSHLTFLVS